MGLVSAPMLCAVTNGNIPGEDAWTRQDFQDGYHSRNRAERRYRRRARRTGRRNERAIWMAELPEQLED